MNRVHECSQEKINALQRNRYFQGLGADLIEQLAEDMHLYQFGTGDPVLWEEEPCQGLYIIKEGRVKLFRCSETGREMIVKIMGPGDTFNEVPVLDGLGNPVNVTAIETCLIWVVRAETIRTLTEMHPEASQKIILNLAGNLRMLIDLTAELSFNTVTSRLVNFLVNQPDSIRYGDQSLMITQDELASRIGTVREVVSRSLKELEDSGAIQVSRGKVLITAPTLLLEWE